MIIQSKEQEVEAQLDCIVDEACDLADQLDAEREAHQRLREAASAVVAIYEEGNAGVSVRLAQALRRLDRELIGATSSLEVVDDPATLETAPPALAWPYPVGTRVTYTDNDGEVWSGCTVRAHGARGWSVGRVRLDNGSPVLDDFMRNGATVSAWATEDQVEVTGG